MFGVIIFIITIIVSITFLSYMYHYFSKRYNCKKSKRKVLNTEKILKLDNFAINSDLAFRMKQIQDIGVVSLGFYLQNGDSIGLMKTFMSTRIESVMKHIINIFDDESKKAILIVNLYIAITLNITLTQKNGIIDIASKLNFNTVKNTNAKDLKSESIYKIMREVQCIFFSEMEKKYNFTRDEIMFYADRYITMALHQIQNTKDSKKIETNKESDKVKGTKIKESLLFLVNYPKISIDDCEDCDELNKIKVVQKYLKNYLYVLEQLKRYKQITYHTEYKVKKEMED